MLVSWVDSLVEWSIPCGSFRNNNTPSRWEIVPPLGNTSSISSQTWTHRLGDIAKHALKALLKSPASLTLALPMMRRDDSWKSLAVTQSVVKIMNFLCLWIVMCVS